MWAVSNDEHGGNFLEVRIFMHIFWVFFLSFVNFDIFNFIVGKQDDLHLFYQNYVCSHQEFVVVNWNPIKFTKGYKFLRTKTKISLNYNMVLGELRRMPTQIKLTVISNNRKPVTIKNDSLHVFSCPKITTVYVES
jgi:hypothetical protein